MEEIAHKKRILHSGVQKKKDLHFCFLKCPNEKKRSVGIIKVSIKNKKEKDFMRKKAIMKRLLCLALSAAMAVTAFTGCKSGKDKSESKGNSALVEEQAKKYANVTDVREITEGVKLTIAIPSNARVLDYNTNHQTKMIEEALGVELNFIELPSADYASKLNVMIMGGEELPDIIFEPSGYSNWIEEGVIYDLSAFYDNTTFAANITEGVERSGVDLTKYITRPEGGIYCIPRFVEETYTSVAQKLWVYQPWLDAIGAAVPTTMDEYYEICKKIVAADLNGNGKKDEIALSGAGLNVWFDCLMSAFVYAHDDSWRILENGQINFAYTTEEWKSGLKYIRKFFEEGLIPKETLSQSSDQYKAIYNAQTPVLFSFGDWVYSGTDIGRREDYTVIPALEGPNGAKYSCNKPVTPVAGAVITTDCENPLAAFLVCDYMCSKEMSITQRYGERGVDWDFMSEVKVGEASEFVPTFEGYEVVFYPYDMINFWNSTEAQNKCYRQVGPMILDQTITAGAGVWIQSSDAEVRRLAEIELMTADAALACYEYQPKEVIDYAPLTVDETNKNADIKAALNGYVEEMTCAFLSGEKDIDTFWNEYLKELENIGYKDYLKTLQTAYDRVH